MEWLPIDTAPKDGTEILIFEPKHYNNDDAIYVVIYTRKGKWVESQGELYHTFYPTHWMPLPDPPKE